jgi:hypothetical protein
METHAASGHLDDSYWWGLVGSYVMGNSASQPSKQLHPSSINQSIKSSRSS